MRPEKLTDLFLPEKSIRILINFVTNWQKGNPVKPAMLLHGPTGVGKTTIAELIARLTERNLITSVPGDERTKEGLFKFFGKGGHKNVILLLEDADLITAEATLIKLLGSAQDMTFITATDLNNVPWKVRQKCLALEVPRPSRAVMKKLTGAPDCVLDVAGNLRQAELLTYEHGLHGSDSAFEPVSELRLPSPFNQRMKRYGDDLSLAEREILVKLHALGKRTPWVGTMETDLWRELVEHRRAS